MNFGMLSALILSEPSWFCLAQQPLIKKKNPSLSEAGSFTGNQLAPLGSSSLFSLYSISLPVQVLSLEPTDGDNLFLYDSHLHSVEWLSCHIISSDFTYPLPSTFPHRTVSRPLTIFVDILWAHLTLLIS